MPPIPAREEDFTVDWLSDALAPYLGSHRIVDAQPLLSDTPGQTAQIVNIVLSFDREEPPLPHRLVAKTTSRDPLIRELVGVFGQYGREVKFYQQFPDVGIPVPDCYYCAHDAGRQEMVIVMNDLSPSLSPSWAIEPEQVKLATEYLPPFHARWWNNEVLKEKDWLVQMDDRDFYHAAAGAAAAAKDAFRTHFGHDADYTIEAVKLADSKVDALLEFMASRPWTLVHGDYHGKQMFFPTGEGGNFAVIDWQFPFVAQGAWDLIRIISLGLTTEERRQRQSELLEGYHASLRSHGVEHYSREELDIDVRLGAWISQNIMAIATGDTDPGILEAECNALGLDWREILLLRGNRMLEELDVLDFLEHI